VVLVWNVELEVTTFMIFYVILDRECP
jgi:hypothetical protein